MDFSPRIGMTLETSGGDQVLFRSTTRGRNELTVSLVNTPRNGDLLLSSDGTAGLVLNLSSLCNAGELALVKVTSPGWTLKQKDGQNQLPLTLSPSQDLRWRDGEALTITISLGAVGAGAKLDLKPIKATLRNLRGDAPDQICASKTLDDFLMLVAALETPKNPLRNALSFSIERVEPTTAGFDNFDDVYTAAGLPYTIANQLRLTIRNLSEKSTLLKARKDGSKPVFTLVFPMVPMAQGDDVSKTYGSTALTTEDLAAGIKIDPTSDGDHGWSASSITAQSLVCEVTPATENKLLFAPGGALELLIRDVKTRLPAFATQIYLLHSGFGEFDEGYEVLTLRKAVPDPQILDFTADPVNIYCGDPVTLSWSVLGADRVDLSYIEGGAPVRKSSAGAPPLLGLPVGTFEHLPYAETTDYTLSLYKMDPANRRSRKVLDKSVRVDVVMPVVEFRMTPPAAARDERVMLTWNLIGKWAFNGRLMEGNTVLQKIVKPAGTPSLTGSMPQSATVNRFYRLTGDWATPTPIHVEAEATLAVVAPVAGIAAFRMYKTVDRIFGELVFRWSGKNTSRFAIGHCDKDAFTGLDGVSPRPGEGRQLTDIFRIVEIDSDNSWGSATVPMSQVIPWPEDGSEPTLQWCNDQIELRDFYLLAWGDEGTSALPIFRKAERLDRDQDM